MLSWGLLAGVIVDRVSRGLWSCCWPRSRAAFADGDRVAPRMKTLVTSPGSWLRGPHLAGLPLESVAVELASPPSEPSPS